MGMGIKNMRCFYLIIKDTNGDTSKYCHPEKINYRFCVLMILEVPRLAASGGWENVCLYVWYAEQSPDLKKIGR